AGQSTRGPGGWLGTEGRPRQPRGAGALAPGVAFRRDGSVALLPPDGLATAVDVVEGFQSYPTLLEGDGRIPAPLREAGNGVDLTHRDSRLALGVLRDGKVLLALTRYEGLGGLLEVLPFGPTTPEMAALVGALGCERAVRLDGGISGQLLVRTPEGTRAWPGIRKVAAGLVAMPRGATPRETGPR
ncbi:MAG: phosphodiester glycosidase family protein, partial [Gemmatimonadetes bacterium]|nr:phosphodiester glycosidase family protein [Gemmatimonadota bacterium]